MTTRVGPMVATLARARGVSYVQLAGVLGIHRNRVTEKIAGRAPFREDEILGLAEFFGVEPGHLFRDPLELLGVISVSESAWRNVSAGQTINLALVA